MGERLTAVEFCIMWQRLGTVVWDIAMSRTPCPELQEDCVQEAALRMDGEGAQASDAHLLIVARRAVNACYMREYRHQQKQNKFAYSVTKWPTSRN